MSTEYEFYETKGSLKNVNNEIPTDKLDYIHFSI